MHNKLYLWDKVLNVDFKLYTVMFLKGTVKEK